MSVFCKDCEFFRHSAARSACMAVKTLRVANEFNGVLISKAETVELSNNSKGECEYYKKTIEPAPPMDQPKQKFLTKLLKWVKGEIKCL